MGTCLVKAAAAALIGYADGFGVGGSLLDPQAGGCSDGKLRRSGSAARAAVAIDVQGAGVDGIIVASVEINAETVTEGGVGLDRDLLGDIADVQREQ